MNNAAAPEARPSAERATFDAYAAAYDDALGRGLILTGEGKEYFAAGRVAHIRAVLQTLGVTPKRVMDYGCGTGSTTPLLREAWNVSSLVGVDPSPESIRVARSQQRSNAVRFERVQEYVPAGDRDLVYSNGVFHHIPPNERPKALAYIAGALASGGIFAFCENNPWNPGTRYVMSRIPFDRDAVTLSPPEARRILRGEGFEIVRTDSLFVFPRPLSWLRSLESALVRVPVGGQYIVFCRRSA
ncbi:MAG: class I SAM-dependent methyltransferase [Gemmatimonadaceae bacterium]